MQDLPCAREVEGMAIRDMDSTSYLKFPQQGGLMGQ